MAYGVTQAMHTWQTVLELEQGVVVMSVATSKVCPTVCHPFPKNVLSSTITGATSAPRLQLQE